ncbi:MAG: NifU family protein [Alphaproteobacteria bacterium]|nr:NifU family protein [Alphaproteobacteria bacterium]MBF0251596.1 NifU family protein [Alphaproteobacteria bacterium]
MFIQTEATPNPATLKFLPGTQVMGSRGTANFTDAATASASPLAARLFGIDGVDSVFLGAEFITVTKGDAADWTVVKPRVLAAVMDHFTQGAPVMNDQAAAAADDNDSDTVKQIKDLLETRVRPAVAQDGGDIVFHSFENGVVFLHMQGACAGCPGSTATLKNGIENMLRHYIPEVKEVRAVN